MTNQEIQAIRERSNKAIDDYTIENVIPVITEDVPKLLDEIDWQKKNVEGYRSNWHKAVHEIQQLRQERDDWKEKAERYGEEIDRLNEPFRKSKEMERLRGIIDTLRQDRDAWQDNAERWADDFDKIKEIAEEERSLKLRAEQKVYEYE